MNEQNKGIDWDGLLDDFDSEPDEVDWGGVIDEAKQATPQRALAAVLKPPSKSKLDKLQDLSQEEPEEKTKALAEVELEALHATGPQLAVSPGFPEANNTLAAAEQTRVVPSPRISGVQSVLAAMALPDFALESEAEATAYVEGQSSTRIVSPFGTNPSVAAKVLPDLSQLPTDSDDEDQPRTPSNLADFLDDSSARALHEAGTRMQYGMAGMVVVPGVQPPQASRGLTYAIAVVGAIVAILIVLAAIR